MWRSTRAATCSTCPSPSSLATVSRCPMISTSTGRFIGSRQVEAVEPAEQPFEPRAHFRAFLFVLFELRRRLGKLLLAFLQTLRQRFLLLPHLFVLADEVVNLAFQQFQVFERHSDCNF